MKSIKVCEYSRSRSYHYDLILQDQASGERSQDQWSSGFCFSHDAPQGGAHMDPRGTAGRIYKEDHYTLLHTKFESSGPCGFGEDFLCFSRGTPRGRARMDPRGTVGRIYKEDHYTLLHTKYESFGPCGFGEDFFMFFQLYVYGS